MTVPRAAIVHLGRERGLGERRRVESWRLVFDAAGVDSVDLPLLGRHDARPWRLPDVVPVLSGRTSVESLSWSPHSAARVLADLDPDIVVCVTTRAFAPRFETQGHLVLDFVDRLSVSYRDRAELSTSWLGRTAYRVLSRSSRRVERSHHPTARRVAAGWADALELGAEWVPNVVTVKAPLSQPVAEYDILFFGNLSYPPNVAALERLAAAWPALRARRRHATALIAGAWPSHHVRRIVASAGWALEAGFSDVTELCQRARVAVAPLVHTAGIQNKVLEAAAAGLPQIVSPEALAGFRPGFPASIARSDAELVAAMSELLDEPRRAARLATDAYDHVIAQYTPQAWAGWARTLLPDDANRPVPPVP